MANRREPRALVQQMAVRKLQDMILSGEFPRGLRLPAQRELSERLKVSRSSLREALPVLETLGLLRTEPGRGTFVTDGEASEAGLDLRWRFDAEYSPSEVYQFRFVVEGYAARLAAMRITDDQLAHLVQTLTQHKDAARAMDLVTISQADFEFHHVIMAASDNRVFVDQHASYRAVFLESQRLPLARHDRLWETVTEHENLLKSLQRHDPDGAAYFMHVHLMRAASRVGVVLSDSL